jgi:hypothetical protein
VVEAPLDAFDELPHAEMSTAARTANERKNRRVIATSLTIPMMYQHHAVPSGPRVKTV